MTPKVVLMLLLLALGGGVALAAEDAAPQRRRRATLRLRESAPAEDTGAEPDRRPVFVPIVDGELLIYPWHRRYRDDFFRRHSYLPGSSLYLRRSYDYGPLTYFDDLPRKRQERVLIVVEPMDAPGTRYYYYDLYPEYYGQPGYFPAVSHEGSRVTIQSPTTDQVSSGEGPDAADEPAEQAVPRASGFGSSLSAMLGGPQRVAVDYAVGELKLKRAEFDAAADAFRRAISARPDMPAAKLALGFALLGAEDYRAAAHIMRRGLRAAADWQALDVELPRVYGNSDAAEVVLSRLQEAVEQDPQNADRRFLLGLLELFAGRYARAVEHLERAERDDPLTEGLLQEAARAARTALGD